MGLLTPIPTTPLYARLEAEGRLDFTDPDVIFHPKRMTREALKRGYARLLHRLYEPEAYFGRLFRGYRGSPAFRRRRAVMDAAVSRRRGVGQWARRTVGGFQQAAKLGFALARAKLLRRLGIAYAKVWLGENLPLGRDALPFHLFVHVCVVHWHFYNVIRLPRKNGFGSIAASQRSAAMERAA
jgi:Domain of unknown function (DUF4070)